MSKLKRLEALEQTIRRRDRRDAELFDLTVNGFESHAAALLARAGKPVPLRIGGQVIEPASCEQLDAFEVQVHSAIRTAVECEQLPLNLASFYQLLPTAE